MIPRRRIPLAWGDLVQHLIAPRVSPAEAANSVHSFEAAAAAYLGLPFVRASSSGRDALGLILDGLGIGAGDSLIVPAYTLGELMPLIEARGIRPLAADVDPRSYNVTPETLSRAIRPGCRGVLIAHMFGAPCDVAGLLRVADAHGLPLIEDCAHAFGAEVGGRKLGSFGRAALFSLEVNKPVSTYGGGLLATADAGLAAFVDRALAARPRNEWPPLKKALFKHVEEVLVRSPFYGVLARLLFGESCAPRFERFYRRVNAGVRGAPLAFSAFQARIGLRRLQQLDDRNRRLNALRDTVIDTLPGGFVAQDRSAVGVPAFYNLVVTSEIEPGALRQAALTAGVDLAIGSEVMDDVAALLGQDDCPGARQLFGRAVMLPLYDGIGAKALAALPRRLERAVALARRRGAS